MRKLIPVVIILVLHVSACKPEAIGVVGVLLYPQTASMTVGDINEGVLALTSKVFPNVASNQTVFWKSSDENIVSVSSAEGTSAEVKAVGGGTAVITVTTQDGDYTAECVVTVYERVSEIRMNIDRLYLPAEKEQQLTVSAVGNNVLDERFPSISWSSGDEKVATVSYGTVRAVAEGKTQIEASVMTGEGKKLTAVCDVTVLPKDGYVPVYAVMFSEEAIEVSVGQTFTPTITVYPPEATELLRVGARYEGVVVNTDGSVTVNRLGSFSVYAIAGEYSDELDIRAVSYEGPIAGLGRVEPDWTPGNLTYRLTLTDETISQSDWSLFRSMEFNSIELILPNIETIDDLDFSSFYELKRIRLDKILSIRDKSPFGLFANCSQLQQFEAPLLKSAGSYAFEGCSALTELNAPQLTTVGDYAFYGCSALTEFDTSQLTTVGDYAFYGCSALTEFDTSQLTTVGHCAFENCSALTEFYAPQLTTVVGDAFYGCSALTEFKAPQLTTAGQDAFRGCTGLGELEVPALETFVNLNDCNMLQKITLGANYQSTYLKELLPSSTFPYLTSLILPRVEGPFILRDWSLKKISMPVAKETGSFSGCIYLTEVECPMATVISPFAFTDCLGLENVVSSSATEIHESAFSGCRNLKNFDCSLVTAIGSCAFQNCTSLTKLIFSSLKETDDRSAVFRGCDSLTLVFPSLVEFDERFLGFITGAPVIYLTSKNNITMNKIGTSLNFRSYTLYLHENKKTEVNDLTWQQRTWKQIFFVDDNGNVVP